MSFLKTLTLNEPQRRFLLAAIAIYLADQVDTEARPDDHIEIEEDVLGNVTPLTHQEGNELAGMIASADHVAISVAQQNPHWTGNKAEDIHTSDPVLLWPLI